MALLAEPKYVGYGGAKLSSCMAGLSFCWFWLQNPQDGLSYHSSGRICGYCGPSDRHYGEQYQHYAPAVIRLC
jgi:hypothetical protein